MTRRTDPPETRDDVLRLSHRMVALHLAGLAILILVVLFSVLWVSREHDKLALDSSESLVRAGVGSIRDRLRMLVQDYSVWDEAYEAAAADDRDWLYANIGSTAAEIGSVDLIVLDDPATGRSRGWRLGSPPAGEADMLPRPLLEAMIAILDEDPDGIDAAPTLLAAYGGGIWAFSLARITPIGGPPAGVAMAALPVQIHGLRLSAQRLDQVGRQLLVSGLGLSAAPDPARASMPLYGPAEQVIGYLDWDPPRPGARIRDSIAWPIGLAVALVAVVTVVSSGYSVRSARRLEQAVRAAKAADQSKTEFLSTVSHELRTPMNGILGVAQLLQTTPLDDEQRELVGVLFGSANAQMALISDLLDFSRIEGGNRQLVEEPFAPAGILKDVSDMMRVAADEKGIGLDARWDAVAEATVRGDGRAFRQIVTNLLGNAVKFTDRGRVEMQATASVEGERVRVAVAVTDTGRGIPAEALPHVFERFYQVDSSMARTTEGTGLGLAISQNLARLMGGGITVESEAGRGSTFVFTARYAAAADGEARDAA